MEPELGAGVEEGVRGEGRDEEVAAIMKVVVSAAVWAVGVT